MKAYFSRTWWEYLTLAVICILVPAVIYRCTHAVLVSFPSLMSIWYFVAIPVLGTAALTLASLRLGRFDYAALIAMELFLLLRYLISSGFALSYPAETSIPAAVLILSVPALIALILSAIGFLVSKRRKS